MPEKSEILISQRSISSMDYFTILIENMNYKKHNNLANKKEVKVFGEITDSKEWYDFQITTLD